jgi:hypothetical protein
MKLPDPAAQTQKYVNMMNATKQQEAAERQATIAQQRLDLETKEDVRRADLQAATLTEKGQAAKESNMKRLRDLSVVVLNTQDPNTREAAYQNLLGLIDKTDDQLSAMMRQVAPTFNADILESAIMNVDTYFAKKYPNATASVDYTAKGGKDAQGNPVPENVAVQITTGRYPSTKVIRNAPEAPPPTPVPTAAPPPTTSGPVPVGKFGETKVAPDGGQLDAFQQDHVRRMKEGLGMTDTPASFTRGGMATPTAGQMSPDMVPAIIDSAVKTGVMAQIDLDQMLALAPPQARQGIVDVLRSNNVSLQADAPSLVTSGMNQQQPMAPNPVQRPQSQFADMRGPAPQASFADLGAQPPMQNTMAQYQPLQRRDPNMAPYPGSAQVPLPRLGAEKRVEAQASKGVELEMAPQIAAATKKVESAAALKSEAPKIKYATEGVLDEVVDRINTIDDLLRNPNRFSIIGPIEGNLPRLLQYGARADAQAAFDKIKNTATLTSLIDMRKSTETGASPVGANPTDRDAKIVEQAASKLIQTGEPAKFDAELLDMRRKLYRTYLSAQRAYDGVYGSVIKENPNLRLAVPKVSSEYTRTTGSGKKGTSTKVDYNNPLLKGMKR